MLGGRAWGVSGGVRRRLRRLAAERGATGRRATAAAGVAGTGEDDDFGEVVRAAQAMKTLRERPRSKREKRRIRWRLASPLTRAGRGHPSRRISAGRREVETAEDGGCWCGGGSGASPEVQGR